MCGWAFGPARFCCACGGVVSDTNLSLWRGRVGLWCGLVPTQMFWLGRVVVCEYRMVGLFGG